jgi:VIT1/CCC1 family predicted Fe2+/Mn2+ transporter
VADNWPSHHRDLHGTAARTRHYLRDLVYGANDGIITTFAVVAGVSGGNLSVRAVLVVGVANLLADGLSMGVGNYLGIKSDESARRAERLPPREEHPARHGAATFLAFALAGGIPLLPYLVPAIEAWRFEASTAATLGALFGVGASRAFVTDVGWLRGGLEMLLLGILVALVAFYSGRVITALLL